MAFHLPRLSGRQLAPPHCGQPHPRQVGAAAHTAALPSSRVAATHLDADGKAAIAHHWATLKARRDHLSLVAEFERRMRAVTYTLKYGPAPTAPAARTTWVCPLINTGAAL